MLCRSLEIIHPTYLKLQGELKSVSPRDVYSCPQPHVHCSIFLNIQDMETASIQPTDEGTLKMWYIWIYVWILFSFKKEWNPVICNREMDFEDIMPKGRSQTQKDKCCMISLICGTSKKAVYSWSRDSMVVTRADGNREVLVGASFNHLSPLKMPLPRELGST